MPLFESRQEPLLPQPHFFWRLTLSLGLGLVLLSVALGLGVLGYHYIARLPWIDSLLNASMILAGMGPVDELPDAAAKVFASCYAIFSGVVFISFMAIFLAPAVHRLLHTFHIDERDVEDS